MVDDLTTTNPWEARRFPTKQAAEAYGPAAENNVPGSGLHPWVALGADGAWLTAKGCGEAPAGSQAAPAAHQRPAGGVRVVDLNPTWTADNEEHRGQGIAFDCPLCRKGRYSVAFKNPLDGLGPTLEFRRHLWERSGTTFDDLSLSPSLNAERCCSGDGCPGWHGNVSGGSCVGGGC